MTDEKEQNKNDLAGLSDEDILKVLKKTQRIQNIRARHNNTLEQDFGKGSARNQPCPNCKAKLKKCVCGFLEKNIE